MPYENFVTNSYKSVGIKLEFQLYCAEGFIIVPFHCEWACIGYQREDPAGN